MPQSPPKGRPHTTSGGRIEPTATAAQHPPSRNGVAVFKDGPRRQPVDRPPLPSPSPTLSRSCNELGTGVGPAGGRKGELNRGGRKSASVGRPTWSASLSDKNTVPPTGQGLGNWATGVLQDNPVTILSCHRHRMGHTVTGNSVLEYRHYRSDAHDFQCQ